MKRILFFAILAVGLTGCTAPDNAQRVLSEQGYTSIEITGYRWFSCGDDYTFHTGFKAKTIAGHPVSGTVCSGVLKGSSIKVD